MKKELLKILRNTEGYVSGEDIGKRLGITRAAVSKMVKNLREEGYLIDSITNKGYRLMDDGDLLDESQFEILATKRIGSRVLCYDTLPSTNDEAKKIAPVSPEGTVVIAGSQSAGKGRMGRQWQSGKNSGIAMSIIVKPEMALVEAVQVTLAVGVAVARGIENVTGLPAMIKWPNDVVIGTKKVCGILTELQSEVDSVNNMVVGVGINTGPGSFPPELTYKATSILAETGVLYKRAPLIRAVLTEFDNIYDEFLSLGLKGVMPSYRERCANLGKAAALSRNGEEIQGRAIDVSDSGELVIEKEDGVQISVFSGEVSVRGFYGSSF